jgi:hypothetical protein
VAANPAKGPNTIPVRASTKKFQLYQTPEGNSGKLIKESETTFTDAKTATRAKNLDFLIFPFLHNTATIQPSIFQVLYKQGKLKPSASEKFEQAIATATAHAKFSLFSKAFPIARIGAHACS